MTVESYTTIAGDTWDIVAYKVYGDCNQISLLLKANRGLADVVMFGAGVVLTVPPPGERAQVGLPPWKRGAAG